MKKILLQEMLKDGLHQLMLPYPKPKLTIKESNYQNNSNNFTVNSSYNESTKDVNVLELELDVWHRKLSHPPYHVLS